MTTPKQRRHESKKLRDSARGMGCTVRIPGVCNHNPETTVLAHLGGGGMGTKNSDLFAAFCCSSCHDILDGRVPTELESNLLYLWHLQAVVKTQQYWLDAGLITLP